MVQPLHSVHFDFACQKLIFLECHLCLITIVCFHKYVYTILLGFSSKLTALAVNKQGRGWYAKPRGNQRTEERDCCKTARILTMLQLKNSNVNGKLQAQTLAQIDDAMLEMLIQARLHCSDSLSCSKLDDTFCRYLSLVLCT